MRLCTFVREAGEGPAAGLHRQPDGSWHLGVFVDGEVIDCCDPAVGLPPDMVDFLNLGAAGMARAEAAWLTKAPRLPWTEVTFGAPVPTPSKFLAIGMNYRSHVSEMGRQSPEFQYWFNKQRTCVVGPDDPIVVPSVSEEVDYEGELALVVGRRCRNVPPERVWEVVAGATIVNDVSVRDWQGRTPTFTVGKSFDSHGPMGPWVSTIDSLGDPDDLHLRTWVNGELRQDSTTSDMIFSCRAMVSYLSSAFTLEPGDVLSTGTPAGVGAGFDPPRWLVPGDRVRIEIEGIGVLENPVTASDGAEPYGLD